MHNKEVLASMSNGLAVYLELLKSNKATDPYDIQLAERGLAEIKALESGDTIASIWSIEDVYDVAEQREYGEITEQQARETLQSVERNHDANYGINWDTLADTLYTILQDAKESK